MFPRSSAVLGVVEEERQSSFVGVELRNAADERLEFSQASPRLVTRPRHVHGSYTSPRRARHPFSQFQGLRMTWSTGVNGGTGASRRQAEQLHANIKYRVLIGSQSSST